MDLKNKVVLLTGASSGIGYSIAKSLPKENCSLALISRRKNILDELVAELKSGGVNAACIQVRAVRTLMVMDLWG